MRADVYQRRETFIVLRGMTEQDRPVSCVSHENCAVFPFNPDNPLASKPPPAPPCQGECPVCPSPDKGRLGGVGVEFLPNSLLNLSPKHVYRNKGKALMVEAN